MALANIELLSAPVREGGNFAFSADLGTLSTTTQTDHVDTIGFHGRMVVSADNGATNPVTFEVQCSHNASDWVTVVLSIDPSTNAEVTDHTVTAGAYDLLYLDPAAVGRYLRLDVTTANANGTGFTVYGERG